MSLTAYGDDKGAAAGAAAAGAFVPKLRAGGYAAWRPDMDVYLARIGAGGAHKRKMDKVSWLKLIEQVQAWNEEALLEALADIGLGSDSSATTSATAAALHGDEKAKSLTQREMTTRKTTASWWISPPRHTERCGPPSRTTCARRRPRAARCR